MTNNRVVEGAKTGGMYVLLIVVSLTATFLGIQWQQTEAEVDQLTRSVLRVEDEAEIEIEKLEVAHETDIARLDESNRTRRNDIADLEERIARLEERTEGG